MTSCPGPRRFPDRSNIGDSMKLLICAMNARSRSLRKGSKKKNLEDWRIIWRLSLKNIIRRTINRTWEDLLDLEWYPWRQPYKLVIDKFRTITEFLDPYILETDFGPLLRYDSNNNADRRYDDHGEGESWDSRHVRSFLRAIGLAPKKPKACKRIGSPVC